MCFCWKNICKFKNSVGTGFGKCYGRLLGTDKGMVEILFEIVYTKD